MGNIYEAIAELVGISDKQSNRHTQFVMVADLGSKDRLYALDEYGRAYKLESLEGIKNNHNWHKQSVDEPLQLNSKQESQTIYQKVHQNEPANNESITYPSLMRTNTGHLVQLVV
jgi:site-specific recombinase XerD